MRQHQNRVETRRPRHVVGQKQGVVERQPQTVEAGIHMQRAGVVTTLGNRRHPEGKLLLGGQNRYQIIVENLAFLALPYA
ncbi:hypothetical protein D3C86_1522100 [compost metagenome]